MHRPDHEVLSLPPLKLYVCWVEPKGIQRMEVPLTTAEDGGLMSQRLYRPGQEFWLEVRLNLEAMEEEPRYRWLFPDLFRWRLRKDRER